MLAAMSADNRSTLGRVSTVMLVKLGCYSLLVDSRPIGGHDVLTGRRLISDTWPT